MDSRSTHDQGGSQPWFVHKTFVVHPKFTEIPAVVCGVDHQGVFGQSLFIEVIEHRSDAIVDPLDTGQVVLHVALVFPLDQRFAFEVLAVDGHTRGFDPEPLVPLLALQLLGGIELQVAASQIVGDGLFVFRKGRWPSFVVIPKRRWFRKFAIGKEGFVLQIRIPLAVGCFVVEHQEERLI